MTPQVDGKGNKIEDNAERWRGETTADLRTIKERLEALVLRIDQHLNICGDRHRQLEHRITTVENCNQSIKSRVAGLARLVIGTAIIIIGTAIIVALFIK